VTLLDDVATLDWLASELGRPGNNSGEWDVATQCNNLEWVPF
jgi:hypothetical protein